MRDLGSSYLAETDLIRQSGVRLGDSDMSIPSSVELPKDGAEWANPKYLGKLRRIAHLTFTYHLGYNVV
jgi:hypothetical protein